MRRDIFQAIAEHFDITRQSISKHLRILSQCDLLAKKQEGREIFYELKIRKNEPAV
jgi:DNA-binding transcriptional ArsR family regulator